MSIALAEEPAQKPELSVEFRRASFEEIEGWKEAKLKGGEKKIFLHPQAEIDLSDVEEVSLERNDQLDELSVVVSLSEEGGKKMRKLTQSHLFKPLAVLVDGEVIMAPVIRESIGGKISISGLKENKAKNLVEQFEQRKKSP